MSIVALALALALPVVVGAALLLACVRAEPSGAATGRVPWILGAGWVTGVLVLTAIMRVETIAGIPFGAVSIALPALALAGLGALAAWRRGVSFAGLACAAVRTLAARDLARPARLAWFALLAWIAVRVAMLLVEASLRPLYAWDAWSAWATKAKAYFAMHAIVPFVDLATWATATTPVWSDAQAWQPATLPLLQAWVVTAIGAWDDASAALPWLLFFVALVLVVYGEVRRRGAPPLHALVAAWLVATLPLLGTQVALAGYADLPLATAFTLGALAGVRAVRTRAPIDIVAAVAALASLALYKSSGWAWLVVALPGLAAAVLGRSWHRRIGVLLVVVAVGIIGVAARFPGFTLGRMSFAHAPAWEAFAVDAVLLANWHLVVLGLVGTMLLRWRRVLDADLAPLTLILATGAGWIAMLVAFPAFRLWGADFLGVNRAVLVLVPFAIAWMAIAMLDAPADEAQAEPTASQPAPEPQPTEPVADAA